MNSATVTRVGIVGAGAIGCTLAARLAAAGQQVSVLARGPALHAIERQGISLSDLDGDHRVNVTASDTPAALGVQDVIFLCTKAQALADLLPSLAPMLSATTQVVPLVNGVPWWYFHGQVGGESHRPIEAVDPGGTLQMGLDLQRIVGAVVFITAELLAPGQAKASNPHLLILGEPSNQRTSRLTQLCALLENAGVEARASDCIRDALWTKIIANLTSNPLSVITGATLNQLYSQPELKAVVGKILQEALLTAAAYGARVAIAPQQFMEMGAGMGPVRTSMLQDYQRGRPLELAAIGDAVVELAERQGLSMPFTRDILNLARFRSQHSH